MKRFLLLTVLIFAFAVSFNLNAQRQQQEEESIVVNPTKVSKAIYHDVFGPLRDLPALTPEEVKALEEKYADRERNEELKERLYPYFSSEPQGPDPVWQKQIGQNQGSKVTLQNFAGQSSYSNPPDCNGTVGPNHYMQTINVTYTIYNKTGTLLAGPTAMNTLFSGVPGASVNDGDPIIMYDEQADRWLAAEFSGVSSNPDYMLIAVSTTNDPTGTWNRWSFVMNGFPDYMKFGIWRDGYYMGTNTGSGDDIYVFERSVMIAGGASPQVVQFDNANRPNSGFHCVLPMDNDGTFASAGTPGQFITINDGAWGYSDQLWIYELSVNWTTPGSSTFNRVQTLNVASFDSNFGSTWQNIPQQGTSQKLDAIPQVLMHRAQYRNWGTSQSLVCCHTVDVDGTDHAGIRWYELQNTGSGWSIRQYGTYAPDAHSRWMASIAMNGQHEIGLGYSVSSSSMYPAIRYCGQSASANAGATGNLDMAETSIMAGTASQTSSERWGDYANISLDPNNDNDFWFTTEYNISGSQKGTRIASFKFAAPPVADFTANNTHPANSLTTVIFTDQSTNSPTTWSWTFTPNTVTYVSGSSTSQNPQVRFNNPGAYTVSLYVTNAYGNDTETKTDYIHVGQPGLWTGNTSTAWSTNTNWENHEVPTSTVDVSITPAAVNWPTKTGNLTIGTDCNSVNMASAYTALTVTGDLTIQTGKTFYVDPSGTALIKVGGNWTATGTFTQGLSTVEFYSTSNSIITAPSGTMTIFQDGFESSSGWTLSGEFEIGGPNGLGGNYGNADPTSAYQGSGVLGVDLTGLGSYNGDYETNLGDRAYQAISPTINCTGFTNVSMNFQRWLNVERSQYDNAYIDISTNNGSTWTNLWHNDYSTTVSDNSWSLQTFNISAYADNQPQVKIRFCIGTTDGSWQYSGWNIDEFNVTGSGSLIATFNNLTINKTNAVVSTNGNVDVQQTFTINPGAYFTNGTGNTFNVLGNAVFMADPSGMASFVDNGTTTFSNPPNVQLFLADGTPGSWHFLSPPITGAQSGLFTGTYLYSFDEPTDSWVNIVSQNVVLNDMQGYSNWATNGSPLLVTFTGPLHNGPYSIPVTRNTTQTDYGWNLVGNPYPSSLDWDAAGWTKTNIDNTIYYYSGNNGGLSNYHYYVGSGTAPYTGVAVNDGTNEIPPLQGFFIHVSTGSTTGTLGVNNNQRIHSGQSYYKGDETDYPIIRIVAEGNGLSDETAIRFLEGSTVAFDGDFDAYKLFADNYPQVYTVTPSGTKLAISTLPEIKEDLVVPVSFNSPIEGTYTFTFTELVGFDQQGDLFIEDLLTGDIQEVDENMVYTFYHSPVNDDNRFLLHFSNPLGIDDNSAQDISIYSYNNIIYVQSYGEQMVNIDVYDVMGQEIISRQTKNENFIKLKVTSGTGYYLVKVQTGKQFITKKLFIK